MSRIVGYTMKNKEYVHIGGIAWRGLRETASVTSFLVRSSWARAHIGACAAAVLVLQHCIRGLLLRKQYERRSHTKQLLRQTSKHTQQVKAKQTQSNRGGNRRPPPSENPCSWTFANLCTWTFVRALFTTHFCSLKQAHNFSTSNC